MNGHQIDLFYNKLASLEGYRSKPYRCPAGVLTIGYGHTGNVKLTDRMTLDQAKQQLKLDVTIVLQQIRSLHYQLEDHEEYALASFIFNIGFTKFRNGSLPSLLEALTNARKKLFNTYVDTVRLRIAEKMQEYKYYHVGSVKKISLGLQIRRSWESNLFLNGIVYSRHIELLDR